MTEDNLGELLAEKEHESWARWMEYLFSKLQPGVDGALVIPADYVAALRVQIAKPYAALTEPEKQYDRDEVAHILPIIRRYARHARAR